jgi:ribosome-binding protein aMBF1 (putative translation factor)
MKCARCSREIASAAAEVRLRDSVMHFGPKCAKLAGIAAIDHLPKPPRRRTIDPMQLPLIEDAPAR